MFSRFFAVTTEVALIAVVSVSAMSGGSGGGDSPFSPTGVVWPTAEEAYQKFKNSGDAILTRDLMVSASFTPVSYNHSVRIPVILTVDNFIGGVRGCIVVLSVRYKSEPLGDALSDAIAAISASLGDEAYQPDAQSGVLYVYDRVYLYFMIDVDNRPIYIGGESVYGAKRQFDQFDPFINNFGEKSDGNPLLHLDRTEPDAQ